jgi:hypothetical protein
LSFICKSCQNLVANDEFGRSIFIPAIGGRVCVKCHTQIQDIIDELHETGMVRFTTVDEDGNIMGIVMEIINTL